MLISYTDASGSGTTTQHVFLQKRRDSLHLSPPLTGASQSCTLRRKSGKYNHAPLGSFSFYLICIKNRFCRDMPVMKNMRALSLAGGIMAMDADPQMGKGSLM